MFTLQRTLLHSSTSLVASFTLALMLSACGGANNAESTSNKADSAAQASTEVSEQAKATPGLQQALPEGPAKDEARLNDRKRVLIANCKVAAKESKPSASVSEVEGYCNCLVEATLSVEPLNVEAKSAEEIQALTAKAAGEYPKAMMKCAEEFGFDVE
jgi:hypothetical protein